jgi:hypothetical protein
MRNCCKCSHIIAQSRLKLQWELSSTSSFLSNDRSRADMADEQHEVFKKSLEVVKAAVNKDVLALVMEHADL